MRTKISKLLFLLFSINIIGCGGSGGSTPTSEALDMLTIDETNSKKVAYSSYNGNLFSLSVFTRALIIPIDLTMKIAGSLENIGIYDCNNGGTLEISKDNLIRKITFNNCKHIETLPNKNYSIDGDFEKDYSSIAKINSNKIKLSYQTDTYLLEIDGKNIKESFDTASNRATLSMEDGYIKYNAIQYDLKNFSYSFNSSTTYLELSGPFKSNCLNSWLDIKTTTPITSDSEIFTNCPTGGDILIKGADDKSIELKIRDDKSIALHLNGSTTPNEVFITCENLKSFAAECAVPEP